MFFMFTLGNLFLILTGFALFARAVGWGTANELVRLGVVVLATQWVPRCTISPCGTCCCFAFIHMYMVFREDIMSGETVSAPWSTASACSSGARG